MKQSKKAKAFAPFSESYGPTSPEVKGIGLHPTNRYKYFNGGQRLGKPVEPELHHSQPTMVSSKSSSGETIGGVDETKPAKKKDQS